MEKAKTDAAAAAESALQEVKDAAAAAAKEAEDKIAGLMAELATAKESIASLTEQLKNGTEAPKGDNGQGETIEDEKIATVIKSVFAYDAPSGARLKLITKGSQVTVIETKEVDGTVWYHVKTDSLEGYVLGTAIQE